MAAPDRPAVWPATVLMLITDRRRLRNRTLVDVVEHAVEGGANIIQVREKDLTYEPLRELAEKVRDAVDGRALLFVNGSMAAAAAVDADGLHLPADGPPVEAARAQLGEGWTIGRSVHTVEAAARAEAEGADYVLAGTVFTTASKPGRAPGGPTLVRSVAAAVAIPVIGVGGITAANAGQVIAAGASGVAVIGAISDADDPRAAAAGLRQATEAAHV